MSMSNPVIIIVPSSVVFWLALGMLAVMIAIAVLAYLLWLSMRTIAVLDCVQHEYETSIEAMWKMLEAILKQASSKEMEEKTDARTQQRTVDGKAPALSEGQPG